MYMKILEKFLQITLTRLRLLINLITMKNDDRWICYFSYMKERKKNIDNLIMAFFLIV